MAKIVDPDLLAQGVEIVITPIDAVGSKPSSGHIRLRPQGDLADPSPSAGFENGITLQCVYSFLKEEWRSDQTLIRYPFPMTPITDEQFELTNGWDFDNFTMKDYPTYKFIRDGGWALKNSAGVSKEEYMNVTTLGSFVQEKRDLAYYVPSELGDRDGNLISSPTSALTPSGFRFTGPVNEAVKIYGSAQYGNFDFRDNFVAYLREAAKTYAIYDLLTEQNLSVLTYKKYAMPLTNTADPKVTHDDDTIFAGADYGNIDVYYYTVAQPRTIGGTIYYFHVIVDCNSNGSNQLAELVYEKVQWLLRQPDNINAHGLDHADPAGVGTSGGKVFGHTALQPMHFVGDTLVTDYVDGWGGVYTDNYNTADINRITWYDDTNSPRQEPYTATGKFIFNDNLTNDDDARYWMFFTSIGTSAYGTSDAWIVRNSTGVPLSGWVSAADVNGELTFTFAYDTDDTGSESGVNHGRTPQTDAPVTVVAIGLQTAQFVKTTSTITRSTANNITVVAALERNYSNPA